MLEKPHNFSPEDSFQEKVKKVDEALNDPAFVEHLNQTFIVNCMHDGSLPYSADRMGWVRDLERNAEKNNEILEFEGHGKLFLDAISACTDGFKKAGSCTLTGKTVFDMVDVWLYLLSEMDIENTNQLSTFAESEIFGALWLVEKKHYDSYQIDLKITGQGLLQDTYQMDIGFRPIPKNIE